MPSLSEKAEGTRQKAEGRGQTPQGRRQTPRRRRHTPQRLVFLWLPVLIYMAAIFYQSSLSDVPGTEGVSDVFLHSVGYGGLALTTIRATAGGTWSGVTLRALALAWLITTGYGVTDEWHQASTPGRTPEFRDVSNDAIGAGVALGLVGAWGIMKRNSHVL